MGEKTMLQKWSTKLHIYNYIDEKDEDCVQKMDLPHDLIIYDIILRLPIKSILQYKSVSKQWYSSLSSSTFGTAHFKFSPFLPVNCVFLHCENIYFLYSFDEDEGKLDINVDYERGLFRIKIGFDGLPNDEINVVGSCNGLVCLYSLLGYLIIWNPIIHQWTKISYPILEGSQNFTWGFGYVSSINDYKVVRITEAEESNMILVHVYSLRTRKWKQIHDEKLHEFSFNGKATMNGAMINETLYWIMYKRGRGDKQGIMGIDLVHERFDEIRGLVPGDSYLSCFRFLGCMGGFLAIGRLTNSGDVSISIVKQNGLIEYRGLYRNMNLCSCCAVIGFTKNRKYFIQSGNHEVGLIDPNCSPPKYIRLVTFKEHSNTRIFSYSPSLISPSAIVETCNYTGK